MQLLVARETTQLAGSSGSKQYLGNMWWPRPCLGSGGEKVEMTKMFSMFGRYKLFSSGSPELCALPAVATFSTERVSPPTFDLGQKDILQ